MKKATLGFRIYKIWQILKRFAGTFRRAQTLKLGGVYAESELKIKHKNTLYITRSFQTLGNVKGAQMGLISDN